MKYFKKIFKIFESTTQFKVWRSSDPEISNIRCWSYHGPKNIYPKGSVLCVLSEKLLLRIALTKSLPQRKNLLNGSKQTQRCEIVLITKHYNIDIIIYANLVNFGFI